MSGTYAIYDFTESLDRVSIDPDDIRAVLAAWGSGGFDYAEWSGGFVLAMKDGTYAKVEGWCDTSGWGCQDGADVTRYDAQPDMDPEWDRDPADLNLWLAKTPEGRKDVW